MNLLETFLLGAIQGLSEFLPISSTGHLTLAGKLLNLINEQRVEEWTAYIAIIQLGTLISVLIYFYNDILIILKNFFQENLLSRKTFSLQSAESKMGWMIIAGNLPIVFAGVFFKDFIEGAFTKNLIVIAISLIVLGVILGLAEKFGTFRKEMKEIGLKESLIIGLAQVMSLIPGSSRSGTTLTAGLFLGLKRDVAARFSFLLGIPAIFASGLLELKEVITKDYSLSSTSLILGVVFSAVFGYLAIDFLLKYLKHKTTFVFVFYRIIIGLVILLLINFNYITK